MSELPIIAANSTSLVFLIVATPLPPHTAAHGHSPIAPGQSRSADAHVAALEDELAEQELRWLELSEALV